MYLSLITKKLTKMKKNFLAFLLLGIFAVSFNACKKDEDGGDDGGDPTPVENSWEVAGTTYTANTALGSIWNEDNTALGSVSTNNSVIAIVFKSKPTAGGTFVVKDGLTTDPVDLAANECTVTIIVPAAPNLYASTGKSGNTVAVTLVGGKLRAAFSGVEMQYIEGSDIKTTTAKGVLLEK
jgi:hypothetical protein